MMRKTLAGLAVTAGLSDDGGGGSGGSGADGAAGADDHERPAEQRR